MLGDSKKSWMILCISVDELHSHSLCCTSENYELSWVTVEISYRA